MKENGSCKLVLNPGGGWDRSQALLRPLPGRACERAHPSGSAAGFSGPGQGVTVMGLGRPQWGVGGCVWPCPG